MFKIVLFSVIWGSWSFNYCFLEASFSIWDHHHWLPWQSSRAYLVISWTRTWNRIARFASTWNSIDRFASIKFLVVWSLWFAYWISWLFNYCLLRASVVTKRRGICCHFKDVGGTFCSISDCRSRLLYKTKPWGNSVCTRTRTCITFVCRLRPYRSIEAPSWRSSAI